MSYRISLVSEQHGYTIRLEKTNFILEKNSKIIEKSDTIQTLAIITDHNTALEAFDILNTLLRVLIEKKILKEDIFRC